MKLRPFEPADEAELVDTWFESRRSVAVFHDEPRTTREQLAERAPRELQGRWTVTVAEGDGRILGFLALALAEERLDQLFVRPEAQGKGVGKALFDVAKARLPNGFWLRTQIDNRNARAFYERRGMVLDRIEGDRPIYVLKPG
jgi:GNAT superfamily N-acetyltransferase